MFTIRLALERDKDEINALIHASGTGLSTGFYTDEQAAAITREVYGVDSALVADGTFFAIESEGAIVACGGWGRRAVDCGGDQAKMGDDRPLDPATEPARIRAFFVHPSLPRRGLGSMLMEHCTAAARQSGFKALELVSTMPGVPLYIRHGFRPLEDIDMPLSGGISVKLTRMRKEIS